MTREVQNPPPPPDAGLLERARGGDREALEALLARYDGAVRAALRGAIHPRFQPLLTLDDVMQQAYTDAFLAIQRFVGDEPAQLVAWLATLARRNLVDAVRLLEADKRAPGDGRVLGGSHIAELAGGSTPSRIVGGQEASEALRSAVSRLPTIYRTVVEQVDLAGRGALDVAEELGRTRGAVYMLRARAHRMLAELLGSASRYFSRF